MSTASTTPTMAASTPASPRFRAIIAALPSRTSSTRSPTPASTASMANTAGPRSLPSRSSGWARSSFAPSSFPFFCVETTLPTTRAMTISPSSSGPRCPRWPRRWAPRREGTAARPRAREAGVLAGRDDRPHHPGQEHLVLHLDGVDDADDGGIDRAVLEAGGHAGRGSADDEHLVAEAGVDGVHGDHVARLVLAAGVDRAHEQELRAQEALVLPRGHHRADHPREDHEEEPVCGRESPISPPCRWAGRPRGWSVAGGSRGPRR